MIADLRPYTEYKESGLPWLGQVPGHWETRVLKRLCSRSALYGANIPASDYVSSGVRFLRTTDITDEGKLRSGGVFVDQKAAHGYMLSDGDILVSRSGTIGRSLRYRLEAHGPCAYAGYLVRFVPAPIVCPDYLFHFTKSLAFADFVRISAISSTIENVNGDKYANMPITLPPPAEQEAIVRFLDWANGRLDRAINAKRKVIALLNEQKQAIIHRAVTRGLDPSVPLKPSGIPWLGDIPQHWSVMPVKRTCRLVRDGTHLPPARTPTGFPLLSVRNMVGGRLVRRPDDSFISKADFEQLNSSFIVRPNDVLMAIVGATLGKVALVEDIGPFQIQRSVSILRPRPELMLHAFLATFLRSPRLQQHLWQSVAFSAQPGIYLGFVANIPVPVPPTITEQISICDGLQKEVSPVDAAISRLEREIELLREYRTRVVADVVTGKLDVRDAAARLPEEASPDTIENDADLGDETEESEA